MKTQIVRRHHIYIKPNPGRVILQYHQLGKPGRIRELIEQVLSLSESHAKILLYNVYHDFAHRHPDFERVLIHNFARVKHFLPQERKISAVKKKLLGAYFSNEYTFESSAQMNPSIVPFPGPGKKVKASGNFIMSLRSVGEGHISSLQFRQGKIGTKGEINLDPMKTTAVSPEIINSPQGESDPLIATFKGQSHISERTIYPLSENECNGIEDARFVWHEDGNYYATYTAYDGRKIRIKLIRTTDFRTFNFYNLSGKAVKNKGMAMFPEKIGGKYAMVSRPDGENMHIVYSDTLYKWTNSIPLVMPRFPWELVQTGNCGSPIKTDSGWLLMIHGVGPVRTYVISACLLDRDDPSKVIGRLSEPLIQANRDERDGYVPNVVYSCGSMLYRDLLVIPFAMSDLISTFASVPLNNIIDQMS